MFLFDPRSIAPRVHARFPCSGSARSQHSGWSGRHTSCSAARQNPGHHCGAAGDPTAQAIGGRDILSGAFLNFSELPPAKGFSRPVLSLLQRHRATFVVANASELADSTRVVPDFNTWVQCFAIYAAVLIAKSPERAPFLLSYTSTLAQFSKRYRFPSWLLYDRKFRGEAAESGRPIGQRRMVLSGVRAQDPPPSMGSKRLFPASSKRSLKRRPPLWASILEPCRRWNWPGEPDRPFGVDCIYLHVCTACKGYHSESRCPKQRPA